MRVCPWGIPISSLTQLVTFSALGSFGTKPSTSFCVISGRCSTKHVVAGGQAGLGAETVEERGKSVLAIPRHERKAARKSRSFRRRQAPVTRGQKRKLRELWPKHGLVMDFHRRWDFSEIFSTTPGAAVTFDIGFGSGESLIEMAVARPKEYFVGIEVHKPGVAAALARLEEEGLTNVKIAQGDAMTALTDHVEDGSLSACCVFFPDPFPQDRDAERRLVRPLFLSLLSSKLRAGGTLHVATDVEAYAEHTVRIIQVDTMGAPENLLKSSPPSTPTSMPSWPPRPATELAHEEEGETGGVESCEEIISQRADGPPREKDASDPPVRSRRQQQFEGVKGDNDSGLPSDKVYARWAGGELQQRPPWRPLTRYEEKAREAGRRVRDFSYRLESQTTSCQPTPAVAAQQ